MSFLLEMINPHWLGEDETQRNDLCLHANVFLKINDDVIDPGTKHQWCVSAGALRLMRSILQNHFWGAEQHLIPCCGHTMIAKNGGTEVDIWGCNNGIDFTVIHCGTQIELISKDGMSWHVSFREYADSILHFAKRVEAYYRQSEIRIPTDEFDETGYVAFWKEWHTLQEKICCFDPLAYHPQLIDFSDYICVTSDSIIDINKSGINYKGKNSAEFINFSECVFNYQMLNGGAGRCIGEIDRTGSVPSVSFYTAPLTTHIFCISKRYVMKKKPFRLIHFDKLSIDDLERQIKMFGYSFSQID